MRVNLLGKDIFIFHWPIPVREGRIHYKQKTFSLKCPDFFNSKLRKEKELSKGYTVLINVFTNGFQQKKTRIVMSGVAITTSIDKNKFC